jgi:hypothetical protein
LIFLGNKNNCRIRLINNFPDWTYAGMAANSIAVNYAEGAISNQNQQYLKIMGLL